MSVSGPPVEGVDQEVEAREPSDLPPPGWFADPLWFSTGYRDPAHRHEWRWWDGASWSAWVSDHGVVGDDPIQGTLPPPRVPASRRRLWPWLVGALLISGAALVAGLVLIGILTQSKPVRVEPYKADLTRGVGEFPTSDSAEYVTSYQSDGYHMVIREPGVAWAPSAITSAKTPEVVSVEIVATPLRVPSGAAFGPFCGADPTSGYGLLIDESGIPHLESYPISEDLGTGPPIPTTPGHSHRLKLTCEYRSPDIQDLGGVDLEGYIDGTRVVMGRTGPVGADRFPVTGIVGQTGSVAPAEWSVSEFSRS